MTNNLEKDFVPYQESLELKKLRFNGKTFAQFSTIKLKPDGGSEWLISFNKYGGGQFDDDTGACIAPTFSQAFRFFREKYNIRQNIMDFIDDEVGIEWDYEIATIGTDLDENGNYKPLIEYSIDNEERKFKSYEEAELSCLRKLIEIVKKK